MPRHNPTLTDDEGRERHGRRLERDGRARTRRRARRIQTAAFEDDGERRRGLHSYGDDRERDLDRQAAEWRTELGLTG